LFHINWYFELNDSKLIRFYCIKCYQICIQGHKKFSFPCANSLTVCKCYCDASVLCLSLLGPLSLRN